MDQYFSSLCKTEDSQIPVLSATSCGLSVKSGYITAPSGFKAVHINKDVSELLIHIHAEFYHAGITSSKYAKVHTRLILRRSRYAASQLGDK